MKAHINRLASMSKRQQEEARETALKLLDGQRVELQDEAATRAIILAVYTVWQTYGIGAKRIQPLIDAMAENIEKALRDDTWIEETVAALQKIGVNFQIKG